MIPFDFEYHRPNTTQAAIDLYLKLQAANKAPLYFSGGTEIITMARLGQIYTQAVIDIKGIPECTVLEATPEHIKIGAAITLARLEEEQVFPLLSRVCNRIADHTSRCKITLGGNLCGKIIYRETVLPLLVADCVVLIAGKNGARQVSIHDVFNKQMNLQADEFIVQVWVPQKYTQMPYRTEKKTKIDRIDYPLITIAALKNNENIQVSFSGLCEYPFRSPLVEEILNDRSRTPEGRALRALDQIPGNIINDINGSSEYRKFVLQYLISDTIRTLEGEHS